MTKLQAGSRDCEWGGHYRWQKAATQRLVRPWEWIESAF
jgi:hypothetical protein